MKKFIGIMHISYSSKAVIYERDYGMGKSASKEIIGLIIG